MVAGTAGSSDSTTASDWAPPGAKAPWSCICVAAPASVDGDADPAAVWAAGLAVVAVGEGNGPVNALDHALRSALAPAYPEHAWGTVLPFRRIFVVAQRAAS